MNIGRYPKQASYDWRQQSLLYCFLCCHEQKPSWLNISEIYKQLSSFRRYEKSLTERLIETQLHAWQTTDIKLRKRRAVIWREIINADIYTVVRHNDRYKEKQRSLRWRVTMSNSIIHRLKDDSWLMRVRKVLPRMTNCYYLSWKHSYNALIHYRLHEMLDVFSMCVVAGLFCRSYR